MIKFVPIISKDIESDYGYELMLLDSAEIFKEQGLFSHIEVESIKINLPFDAIWALMLIEGKESSTLLSNKDVCSSQKFINFEETLGNKLGLLLGHNLVLSVDVPVGQQITFINML